MLWDKFVRYISKYSFLRQPPTDLRSGGRTGVSVPVEYQLPPGMDRDFFPQINFWEVADEVLSSAEVYSSLEEAFYETTPTPLPVWDRAPITLASDINTSRKTRKQYIQKAVPHIDLKRQGKHISRFLRMLPDSASVQVVGDFAMAAWALNEDNSENPTRIFMVANLNGIDSVEITSVLQENARDNRVLNLMSLVPRGVPVKIQTPKWWIKLLSIGAIATAMSSFRQDGSLGMQEMNLYSLKHDLKWVWAHEGQHFKWARQVSNRDDAVGHMKRNALLNSVRLTSRILFLFGTTVAASVLMGSMLFGGSLALIPVAFLPYLAVGAGSYASSRKTDNPLGHGFHEHIEDELRAQVRGDIAKQVLAVDGFYGTPPRVRDMQQVANSFRNYRWRYSAYQLLTWSLIDRFRKDTPREQTSPQVQRPLGSSFQLSPA